MIQLDPHTYERVRPLFAPLAQHLIVDSILSQHTIGRVYADHATHPQTAVIWNQMDTILIGGAAHNDGVNRALRWLLLANLLPDARARHIPGFTLLPATPAWEAALQEIVTQRPLIKLPRRAFLLAPNHLPNAPQLANGFQLHPLNDTFLADTARANMTAVHGWIDSFWPSQTDFLRHGVGYAVTHGDTIAAWCLSVYAGQTDQQQALELGVETAVSYRSQGLATAAAAACLQQCQQRNITPHWQCNQNNPPSQKVAVKLGFTPIFDYNAYWLPFTTHDERHPQE